MAVAVMLLCLMPVTQISKIPFAALTASLPADWMSYTAKSCRPIHVPFIDTYLFCRQLDLDALVAAVRALEALAHERTVARLKQGSEDGTSYDDEDRALPYDPASVFLLEMMASITCQTTQHIEELW
jgi:hypothetical protein